MKTSCEIIKDLLPLYNDNVCSPESCDLVGEHIKECDSCKALLDAISDELAHPVCDLDEARPIKVIRAVWKRDRIKSLIKGVVIAVANCAVLAVSAYIVYSPRQILQGSYSMAYDIERSYAPDGSYGVSYKTVDDDYFLISRMLYQGEDVTERFDPEKVAALLSDTMSRRTSRQIGTADMLWDIEITRMGGPIHICLGQSAANSGDMLNYWYQSGPYYQIIDPTALINSLDEMMDFKRSAVSPYELRGGEYRLGNLLMPTTGADIFSFNASADYMMVRIRCDVYSKGELVDSSVLRHYLDGSQDVEGLIAVVYDGRVMKLSLTRPARGSNLSFELENVQEPGEGGGSWFGSQGLQRSFEIEDNKEIPLFVYATNADGTVMYPPERIADDPDLLSRYDSLYFVTCVFSR